MRFFVVSLLAALSGGCSGAQLLNTLTPSSSFERERDVAYGELPRQTLDVYRATEPDPELPTLVFVHGGGWNEGDKALYKFIGDGFAKEGFDVVVPNYRLHPEAVYPSMVEDTARAARWAVEAFGRPVVLMGHSAGGYNALQTVFAPEIGLEAGLETCADVAGVIALAAPTGAAPLDEEPYISVFPNRFTGDDAPLGRLRAGLERVPPILLVHGAEDEVVGPDNSTEIAEALGPRARAFIVDGRDHVDVVRLLARRFEDDSSIKALVVAAMRAAPREGDLCAAPEFAPEPSAG